MYEGKPVGTPDAGAFWRVISQHKVAAFFTAPTAFRAIKREDPDGHFIRAHDLSRFRTLFLAGERGRPADRRLGRGAPEACRSSTIGGRPRPAGRSAPIAWGSSACRSSTARPALPVPGWDVRVLDHEAEGSADEVKRGEIGAIAIKLPLPPGSLADPVAERRALRVVLPAARFPAIYQTGDAGFIDDDGYLYVMTRTDDIINVAGHRLSTGGMEEVLAAHPDVAECAVIGVADAAQGPGAGRPDRAQGRRRPAARARSSARRSRWCASASARSPASRRRWSSTACPRRAPGKILRGTMRRIADGEAYTVPATIDDPVILDEITIVLGNAGFPQRN